jgi:serine/threonine-protein kinase
MVLEKGSVFAEKYEILEVLSSGAQASVYSALQKPLDRVVILKILSPILVANQEIVLRFEREAKLLSTIKEENVTRIYDYGRYNGVYFFVSEYVEGQSVKELLERKGRPPAPLASYIILESAKILDRLHKQGVVHRDLKPGNILISHDGKIKLTDFGLAFSQALPSITIEGSILGTPAYMSPEQITGKTIDNRSDIYSLGVVFYELLVGTNPFIASTYSAIMHNVLNLKLAPTYKIDSALEDTKDLWQIIERMIKTSADERFVNIREVCDKLEIWFKKEINKNWRLDLSDLTKETKEQAIPALAKRKPVSFQWAMVLVGIILLLVIIFTAIRILKRINKPVQSQAASLSPGSVLSRPYGQRRDSSTKAENITPTTKSQSASPKPVKDTLTNAPIVGNGFLKISALPWATIFIDEKEIFTTPKDTLIELPSGQHDINFVNPSFPLVESIITVKPHEQQKIMIDLFERVSYLQISVSPWADVYIDDVFKVTIPLSNPLMVGVGTHKITLKNPYFAPYEEMINFKPRDTIERNIILK